MKNLKLFLILFLITLGKQILPFENLSKMYKTDQEKVITLIKDNQQFFCTTIKFKYKYGLCFQKFENGILVEKMKSLLFFDNEIEILQINIREKFEPNRIYVFARDNVKGTFLIRFDQNGYDNKYGIHYLTHQN